VLPQSRASNKHAKDILLNMVSPLPGSCLSAMGFSPGFPDGLLPTTAIGLSDDSIACRKISKAFFPLGEGGIRLFPGHGDLGHLF